MPAIALSVIIGSYNRVGMLRACLNHLNRQSQPASDFEVVVVVDGSTDGTMEMLSDLATPYRLQVIWQENAGQAAALNAGIQKAQAPHCLLLDDDILADEDLISVHLRLHQEEPGTVGLGRLSLGVPPRADGFAKWLAAEWIAHYDRLQLKEPSFTDCYSGNMSVRRDALLKIAGFALDIPRGFDVELGNRLFKAGVRFVYLPDAAGHQVYDKTYAAIARDAERAGEAALTLYKRHPEMLSTMYLAGFHVGAPKAVLLRRLLLAANVPGLLLRPVGAVFQRSKSRHLWYLFLFRYFYWRGVKRSLQLERSTWRQMTWGTPILTYHAFSDEDEPSNRYVITGRRFAQQLAWMRRRGYIVCSLDEYVRFRRENRFPPYKSVVLTFDDGYRDNMMVAYPILAHYGNPVTIFLVSGSVGTTNDWDETGVLARRPLLSWKEIRTLASNGICIGAHGRTHASLRGMQAEQIDVEVAGSRQDLEEGLGSPVTFFAYPYGQRDASVETAVSRAGFLSGCGMGGGANDMQVPLMSLRRIDVRGGDSFWRFAIALVAGTNRFPIRKW